MDKYDNIKYSTMVHAYCTGPGQEPGLPRTMGFYITIWSAHTTQGQGMMGFYITIWTAHTTQGQRTIVFYSAHPGPFPCPGPGSVECA